MDHLIEDCMRIGNVTRQLGPLADTAFAVTNPYALEGRLYGRQLIFPGTKWCGEGNIANDYDDLGPERETDMCCRTHDHCTDSIAAGGNKHGLHNNGTYTLSNCTCDHTFYGCLQKNKMSTSDLVGMLYFNTLATPCFKKDYPIVRCLKSWGLVPWRQACQEYELDTTKPKIWQFFDALKYVSLYL